MTITKESTNHIYYKNNDTGYIKLLLVSSRIQSLSFKQKCVRKA